MYIDLPSLHQVMLDYTSKCNALCLRCARNVEGKFLNKNMPIADMPWNVFEAFFEPALNYINVLEYVGNFGDPALHPDLIKGIEWLRQRENPSLRQSLGKWPHPTFQIATNGGMNSPDWWRDLAKVLPRRLDKGFLVDILRWSIKISSTAHHSLAAHLLTLLPLIDKGFINLCVEWNNCEGSISCKSI